MVNTTSAQLIRFNTAFVRTMYKKETGNDKQGKDVGNWMLCQYRNFSQAIMLHIKPQSNDPNFSCNNAQHLLWRKSLYCLTTVLCVVVSCCMLLYHVAWVCSRSKMFVEQMLCDRTFILFSAMLHVVAFIWPPSQTLLCSRLRSGILISHNYRLNPLFTFNLYLSGFKSSSVKQNLRIAIQLLLICRSSRMYCKMTQNIIY